jgi:prepilin-type N-terminal cleavage/methylation domain-containing protein
MRTGFTLLEGLVALAIVGIITALAVPSWIGWLNNQKLTDAQSKIERAIAKAKSEAKRTKTNKTVVLGENLVEVEGHSRETFEQARGIPETITFNFRGHPSDKVPKTLRVELNGKQNCIAIITLIGTTAKGFSKDRCDELQ